VLCGGRSTRLGSDKGLFAPLGDEPLFARALRLLGERFPELLLVVRNDEQAERYRQALQRIGDADFLARTRIVCDLDVDAEAPSAAIAGVRTALAEATHDTVIALPVDAIGVRAIHLSRLLVGAGNAIAACFGTVSELTAGLIPFPSLWRRPAIVSLANRVFRGSYGVRAALAELGAAAVDPGPFAAELDANSNTQSDLNAYFGEPLFDPFGRRLHYVRFSLTEACNMSCTYCLPEGFPEWYRHKARLSSAEVQTMLAGFRRLGFRKVRLTGGEPTVHPGCFDAVHTARRLGYEEIAITTNALLIGDVTRWLDAGLTQLNVSLDSLDPTAFKAITKNAQLERILGVIEQAIDLGIEVKINSVLLRSVNGTSEQIAAMIDWALARPVTLRFIELMPTKLNTSFAGGERVLGSELEPLLSQRGLERVNPRAGSPNLLGPSTNYSHSVLPGRIGLINPMSCNFCDRCNRLRITARGELKLCLFGDKDHSIDLASPETVAAHVRQLISTKPERHHLEDGNFGNVSTFRTIGG
jgi:cyclic pyranopterin phosphate synthase